MSTQFIASPIGTLRITADADVVTGITLVRKKGVSNPDAVTERCASELEAYFAKRKKEFSVRMHASGTPFQQSVWKAMSAIPYGKTQTYADIARSIGKPKAVRAVGSACGKNALLVLIPCHRVVGSHGHLGGFSSGINNKKWLLAHEQQSVK